MKKPVFERASFFSEDIVLELSGKIQHVGVQLAEIDPDVVVLNPGDVGFDDLLFP